jgi:hypothetical protein
MDPIFGETSQESCRPWINHNPILGFGLSVQTSRYINLMLWNMSNNAKGLSTK